MPLLDYLRELWHVTPVPMRTFATAGAGVVFGAWLTSRAQTKRTIVSEVHALRAAHALCFSIANKALALKKQHLLPMKTSYDEATEAHDKLMSGPGPAAFEIQLDLRTLSKVAFPTQNLEKLIFDKCFIDGFGIATAVAVADATHDLNVAIDYRNELIIDLRKNLPDDMQSRIAIYLGLYNGDAVDDRVRNNVDALYQQADNCIFFACRLEEAIRTHENKVRRRAWYYRLPGRSLRPANWAAPEQAGLMPLASDYEGWTKGFVRRPSVAQKVWKFLTRSA